MINITNIMVDSNAFPNSKSCNVNRRMIQTVGMKKRLTKESIETT